VTRHDAILILVIALLAMVAVPVVASARGEADEAIITGPGGETIVPLGRDGEFEIDGRQGTVRVRVHDGAVAVIDSRCPDEICMSTGSISAPGSVVACVPNGVIVRIEGGADGVYDARTR
jgi:hypothetical protein